MTDDQQDDQAWGYSVPFLAAGVDGDATVSGVTISTANTFTAPNTITFNED